MLKTLILAGGKGTRIKEYTENIPKPLIEANGKPLFMHIIKNYEKYGVNFFALLGGYKQEELVKYLESNFKKISKNENLFQLETLSKVLVLDTGQQSMTGGRIRVALDYFEDAEFFLTYGDGISDINIGNLFAFFNKTKKLATVTAVQPKARFGSLKLSENDVIEFNEKVDNKDTWINGGFFVIKREIKEIIKNEMTLFEKEPLEHLAKTSNLSAYKHTGFWQPVDTIRDLEILEIYLKNDK